MIKKEKESRKNILAAARANGLEEEVLKIFNRYDNALKGCKTEQEKYTVGIMGIMELNKLFGGTGTELDLSLNKKE